ncbi:DUF6279 family lipoprotein [Bdellovibrio sp. 22V]|uniref:DUF6279 family lipoprotein n=1 Tax=Bdellovibrio TaxID=958 RepID=UPI002542AA00|nr:DUF6279 family lipoprotein [Bdellovibrio sp. 22V]WII73638.1 DUF6279 family lipoprotein [Bdellovibrio sp. 22V]
MIKTIFLICASLFCFSACSRLDLAVNWADTFLAAKVDDYFDISSEQKKELKKYLQADFKRLKNELLPQWMDEISKFKSDVAQGSLTKNRVELYFNTVMKNVSSFTGHFSETAVSFMASVDSNQLNHFNKAFRDKAKEDHEKISDTQKYRNNLRDKYYKYFEMFLGDLTAEQKNLIEKHLNETPYPAALKLKNKEHVFQTFLKERGSPEQIALFVKNYSAHPEQYSLPEYKQAYQQYQQSLEKLVVQVLTSLNANQKAELLNNLSEKLAQLERIRKRG